MKKTLLVIGTGGVASAVIVEAVRNGMDVYVTSSSVNEEKTEYVKSLGATLVPETFNADFIGDETPAAKIAEWFKTKKIKIDFVLSSAAAGIAGFLNEQKKKKDTAAFGFFKGLASGKLSEGDIPDILRERLEYGFGGHLVYLENDLKEAGVLSENFKFFAVSYSGECYYPVAFAKRYLERLCKAYGYIVISIPEIANKAADVFAGLKLFVYYYAHKAGMFESQTGYMVENEMDKLLKKREKNAIGDYLFTLELESLTKDVKIAMGAEEFDTLVYKLSATLNEQVSRLYVSEMLNPRILSGSHYSVSAESLYKKDEMISTKELGILPDSKEEMRIYSYDDMLGLGVFGSGFLLPDSLEINKSGDYARGFMVIPELSEKSDSLNTKMKQGILSGHFTDFALLPGSIACELGLQVASCAYMLISDNKEKIYPQLLGVDDYAPIFLVPGDKVVIDTKILEEVGGVFTVMIRLKSGIQSTFFTAKCLFVNEQKLKKTAKRVKMDI